MLIMVALWYRADHCIFILWFLLSVFFFSPPNLSGRTLDVYHTSTHGAAIVRIQNAGPKCAARGSLKRRGRKKVAKNRHLGTIQRAPPIFCRAAITLGIGRPSSSQFFS